MLRAHPSLRVASIGAAPVLAAALALAVAAPVAAHVPKTVGAYTIEVGWKDEPALVGQPNAVIAIVTDAEGNPVTDLPDEALKVVISTGGQESDALAFEPAFNAEEAEGPLGEYDAAIVPTAPGGYDFHITGTVKGEKVDLAVTASETQEPVTGTTDLQFPAKVPSLTEIATRLDRIDARVQALGSGAASQADVDGARADAQRALLVGAGLGLAGIVVGAVGVLLALRARPRLAQS
jgi:hypothetical protein